MCSSQLALADMLRPGRVDAHFRRLRHTLAQRQQQMRAALMRLFPEARISNPDGGYFSGSNLTPASMAGRLHQRHRTGALHRPRGPLLQPGPAQPLPAPQQLPSLEPATGRGASPGWRASRPATGNLAEPPTHTTRARNGPFASECALSGHGL